MTKYELIPNNGQKSFYGKAVVFVEHNGTETLCSYGTPIIKRTQNGTLVKLWNGWTATTGKHIKAFCGLNKKEFEKLSPAVSYPMAANMTPQESYNAMIARRYFNQSKA